MASMVASRIASDGRKLFPTNDLGYGPLFRDASRLKLRPDNANPFGCDVTLIRKTPRVFSEGRLWPAWFTEEANVWLYQKLHEAGCDPQFVDISSPVSIDINGIILQDDLISLFPTAEDAANYGRVNDSIPNPIFIFRQRLVDMSAIGEYWRGREDISSSIRFGNTIPISCEENDGQFFFHYLNFFYNQSALLFKPVTFTSTTMTGPSKFFLPPTTLLLLFSTVVAQSGFPRLKLLTPINVNAMEFDSVEGRASELDMSNITVSADIQGYCLMHDSGLIPISYSIFDNPLPACSINRQNAVELNHRFARDYYRTILRLLVLE